MCCYTGCQKRRAVNGLKWSYPTVDLACYNTMPVKPLVQWLWGNQRLSDKIEDPLHRREFISGTKDTIKAQGLKKS